MESNTNKENVPVVSTGEWVASKFLLLIPIVNIIFLFVWAFNKSENKNKSNWAKATLIVYVLRVFIYILIILMFFSFFASLFNSAYYI
jgi:heme/copper-type cytochrome/quinol oxidase subunit 2